MYDEKEYKKFSEELLVEIHEELEALILADEKVEHCFYDNKVIELLWKAYEQGYQDRIDDFDRDEDDTEEPSQVNVQSNQSQVDVDRCHPNNLATAGSLLLKCVTCGMPYWDIDIDRCQHESDGHLYDTRKLRMTYVPIDRTWKELLDIGCNNKCLKCGEFYR